MLKLGILTQLDETLPMPNKKVAYLYKFNPESYSQILKEKVLDWNSNMEERITEVFNGTRWSRGDNTLFELALKEIQKVSPLLNVRFG